MLEQSYGSLKDVEAAHVDSLVRLLFGNTGKCVHLPGGVMATNERNRMVVSDPGASACPWPVLEQAYTLKIPGETRMPGWRVTADMIGENFYREDDIFSASFDIEQDRPSVDCQGTPTRRPLPSARHGAQPQTAGLHGRFGHTALLA